MGAQLSKQFMPDSPKDVCKNLIPLGFLHSFAVTLLIPQFRRGICDVFSKGILDTGGFTYSGTSVDLHGFKVDNWAAFGAAQFFIIGLQHSIIGSNIGDWGNGSDHLDKFACDIMMCGNLFMSFVCPMNFYWIYTVASFGLRYAKSRTSTKEENKDGKDESKSLSSDRQKGYGLVDVLGTVFKTTAIAQCMSVFVLPCFRDPLTEIFMNGVWNTSEVHGMAAIFSKSSEIGPKFGALHYFFNGALNYVIGCTVLCWANKSEALDKSAAVVAGGGSLLLAMALPSSGYFGGVPLGINMWKKLRRTSGKDVEKDSKKTK
eukprot:jgi/Bigna1/84431/fgenesh1_pg.136_\